MVIAGPAVCSAECDVIGKLSQSRKYELYEELKSDQKGFGIILNMLYEMLLEIWITDGKCGIGRDYEGGSKVNIDIGVNIEDIFKAVRKCTAINLNQISEQNLEENVLYVQEDLYPSP
jgi:hypothetical protein